MIKNEIKTALVLGVIIAVVVIIISTSLSALDSMSNNTKSSLTETIDKSKFKKAPELQGIAGYINTTPEKLNEEIKGKVVLYDIWTYSCINCVRTLPYITSWNEKYKDQGLLIIGIHSPEFDFEKDINNVETAVKKYGITYPVVLDNEMKTWKAFENRYWPRKYITDDQGYIRYDHIGEGNYDETEKIIQKLLEERATNQGIKTNISKSLVQMDEKDLTGFRTPELYFGYKYANGRNQLGSNEGFVPETIVSYKTPDNLELHRFYPIGEWKNLADSMELKSTEGSIELLFHAKDVNIVTEGEAQIQILLDGNPITEKDRGSDVIGDTLKTKEAGLYNIIKSSDDQTHDLTLKITNSGFKIFTFTFG